MVQAAAQTVSAPSQGFGAEGRALLHKFSALAQSEFAPHAERWDRENRFPAENFRRLKEENWLRVPVSRRFGGLGFGLHENPVAWVSFVRALAKACGNTGQTFQIWGHCMSMVEELSTPEQGARFTREAMNEGAIWCSGGSEPANYTQKRQTGGPKVRASTETTAKARSTVARQVEGGVIVSGRKLFISNSSAADRFFIFADLQAPDGTPLGLAHPVIRRGAKGLTVLNSWDAMGMRGTASDDLVMEDVFVPHADLIGAHKPNAYFTSVLAGSFLVGRAAVYMGIADAAFEFLVGYIRDKVKASDDMVMQFRIGQLETRRQNALAILYRAAQLWEQALQGEADPDECSSFAALTHCAVIEASLAITSEALELAGGRGMLRSSPLERYYRDVRAYSVSPPTINASMVNIGSRLLSPGALRETLVGEGV
jgi:alkylation response protein AidB-like acyl-CoA dehydrogenase